MSSVRRICALALTLLAVLLVAIAVPSGASAETKTKSFGPVERAARAAFFKPRGLDPQTIKRAKLTAHTPHRRIRRDVGVARLRSKVASGERLRIRLGSRAKRGKLEVVIAEPTVPPVEEPPIEEPPIEEPPVEEPPVEEPPVELPGGCLPSLNLNRCTELFSDMSTNANADAVWGTTGCQSDSRHRLISSGGDPNVTALGLPQVGDGFRRLTTIDGDDYYGERCELGRNDHRYGTGGGSGTAALFREGQRRITSASFRLPSNFPLETNDWQVLMQMKQAQPSANGGGTPALAFRAYRNRWALVQSDSSGPTSVSHDIWSAPAVRNTWTRFAFDVTYSQHSNIGRIKVYADLNGDGDMDDAGEQSPRFETYTMKREIAGGNPDDGIAPGESIPSHLRVGIYHNPTIACPPPNGCSVDVDNVQVVAP